MEFDEGNASGEPSEANIDVTICSCCGGAVKIIASIEDPLVIKKILEHLDAKSGALACPWRIPNSSSDRKVKQTTTVLLPSVIIDIHHLSAYGTYGCRAILARMSPALVEIALKFMQLAL